MVFQNFEVIVLFKHANRGFFGMHYFTTITHNNLFSNINKKEEKSCIKLILLNYHTLSDLFNEKSLFNKIKKYLSKYFRTEITHFKTKFYNYR